MVLKPNLSLLSSKLSLNAIYIIEVTKASLFWIITNTFKKTIYFQKTIETTFICTSFAPQAMRLTNGCPAANDLVLPQKKSKFK